jgi:hypothetical protein
MNFRDLIVSEHADEGQNVQGSIAQNQTTILVVKSYWNKESVKVALFTNDMDPLMSDQIIRNVTREIAFINYQSDEENQTSSTENTTTVTPLVYDSWVRLLQTMQTRQGVNLPTMNIVSDEAASQNADIKIFFEGKPHPEGSALGMTTAMYDGQTLEIVSADIHIYRSYQSYQEGILGAILRHELGHALGLGHSTDMTSIMYKRVVIKNDVVIGVIGQCESDALEMAYIENKIRDISCNTGVQG